MFTRRIVAAALIVFLPAGGSGLCAGWEATPEARMACCLDGGTCPMHPPGERGTSSTSNIVSQADADSCCGASERDDSTPSSSAFVPLVSLGPVVSPASVAVAVPATTFDVWRTVVPLSGSHVRKHLLLSVFLI